MVVFYFERFLLIVDDVSAIMAWTNVTGKAVAGLEEACIANNNCDSGTPQEST